MFYKFFVSWEIWKSFNYKCYTKQFLQANNLQFSKVLFDSFTWSPICIACSEGFTILHYLLNYLYKGLKQEYARIVTVVCVCVTFSLSRFLSTKKLDIGILNYIVWANSLVDSTVHRSWLVSLVRFSFFN